MSLEFSQSQSSPKSVLIVLMGAIGDVARGLSVATRIKAGWPETKITWAVEPISLGLVEDHESIDRVVVFQRGGGLPAFLRFVREVRDEPYDVVLDLQRHFKSGVTSWLSGCQRRIGYDRANSREGNWIFNTELITPVPRLTPKIDQFQAFADAIGVPKVDKLTFGLQPKAGEVEKFSRILGKLEVSVNGFLAFLIGSTWESRLWPAEHFAALAGLLHRRHDLIPVLIGAPSEVELAAKIENQTGEGRSINLVGKTTLRELVPLFSLMKAAVGSDSGPMHIASAVGLPVVSIWGPTSPIRSGPWGSEQYMMQSAIGCSPCYLRRCPGLGTACMRSVQPEDVLAMLERALGEHLPS